MKEWEAPVFYPTKADLDGPFEDYIEKIERRFAKYGICRIIPPKGWTPRKAGYENLNFTVGKPIRQHATGRKGLFRALLIEGKPMSLKKEFKPMATSPECAPPATENASELERFYWKNVTLNPPLYGADCPGSLFDSSVKGWNIAKLDTLLSRTLESNKCQISGVTTPYLYFGTWRSTFAWHCEDMDLYSVNYLHFGAKKFWYCIPPEYKAKFELMLKGQLPELFRGCPEFMRHKELLVSPWLLQQYNIPVIKMVHEPGQFVINYPGAYHSGFNHGFNCAESTNFATQRWVPIGRKASICECSRDSVNIDMDLFSPGKKRKKVESDDDDSDGSPSEKKRGLSSPDSGAGRSMGGARSMGGGGGGSLPDGVRPRIAPGKKVKLPIKVLPDGRIIVKRGPGRPRKHPLPGEENIIYAPAAKRGRGRPPKNPVLVDAMGNPVKRGRGRPPLSASGQLTKAAAAKLVRQMGAGGVDTPSTPAQRPVVLTKAGLPRKKPGPKPKNLLAQLAAAGPGGGGRAPGGGLVVRKARTVTSTEAPKKKHGPPASKGSGRSDPFVPRRKRVTKEESPSKAKTAKAKAGGGSASAAARAKKLLGAAKAKTKSPTAPKHKLSARQLAARAKARR